jgi:hypothetical protein
MSYFDTTGFALKLSTMDPSSGVFSLLKGVGISKVAIVLFTTCMLQKKEVE